MNTQLPGFNGFYGTQLEWTIENAEDDYLEYNNLTYDEVEFNYSKIKKEIAVDYCAYISELLKEIDIDNKIQFKAINSPREYNFSNDEIEIDIAINPHKVLTVLQPYEKEFSAYIKEQFTTRSGFISFMSNDSQDWIADILLGEDIERKLPVVLTFLLNENFDIEGDFFDSHYEYEIEVL